MKLIPMTDFVLEQTTSFEAADKLDFLEVREMILSRIEKYAKFLKQHLKLEMFVPCDNEGELFDEPELTDYPREIFYPETGFTQREGYEVESFESDLLEYKKAKEKVLFEVTSLPSKTELELLIYGETVELLCQGDDVKLTNSALIQLGLESKKALAKK